jgi:hypothetical protein
MGSRLLNLYDESRRESVTSEELGALAADGHSRTRATELVIERAVRDASDASTVVLVEGVSDQIALEVVAARRGRALRGEGTFIVPMGGATNVGRFLALFGPQGRNLRLAGLYDFAQEEHFAGRLERAGVGSSLDHAKLAGLGFHVCVADLEDEFIRSLTAAAAEQVIGREGDLASFRRMQHEPFHRMRTHEQQIHRFIGTHAGRKYRYARLFAEAVGLDRIPNPIDQLLAYL